MHITALWGSEQLAVEVDEDCRSLAALESAVHAALPEGVDVAKVCLEVGGRPANDDDVLTLEEGSSVDVLPTPAARAATRLLEEGHTADVAGFCAAAEDGDLRLCTLYLDAGVDCPSGSETPLHIACNEGLVELCTLLLDRGVDVDVGDEDGDRPLFFAALKRSAELCTLLLDRGADVNARSHNGETVLHWAVWRDNGPMCNLLLDRGADVDAPDDEGFTPLHRTVTRASYRDEKLELCRLLLDRGADVHHQNKQGGTPFLSSEGKPGVKRLLLSHRLPARDESQKKS
eukprot:Rhum_TRINITY_DN3148_c0_g1::Rhum_TRINITY_DN3148_c0_g1_i1::g.9707::m.9707